MACLHAPVRLRPLLVAIALLVPLAACGDDDESAGDTTTTVDETTTTADETTTTTTAQPDGEAPDQIAAVLADGTLALLDAESGEVVATLLDGIDVSDPAKNGITVTPDGEEIFVVRPTTEAGTDHDIVRVSTEDGGSEVVVQGRAPAVSPDGSTLAYVDVEVPDEPGHPVPVVVLHDLETGEERRLEREDEPDFFFVADVAWTGDGEQLALVVGEIQTGVHLVDADADNLDAAEDLGPEARDEGTSWLAVTAFDDERLAVVETCCDVPATERWHVIAVHPSTGTVEGTVLPEEKVEASRVDTDDSTDHLVVVTDLRPGGGTLLRWTSPEADGADGVGELEQVRDGVMVAAW